MSKLWEKSGTIEFDNNGEPADGAIANFFVGGTTTPLTVYEDGDETTPHESDVETDANGRWPAVFIPFTTTYDVRVTTEGGTQLYYHQNIPNPSPVEASEDSVDANALIATGDVIWSPKAGTRTGFVRLNGRTIGNAASGATERANADTEDLFTFLWTNLANGQAAVSSGRGGSAAADFAANKTIALLDLRGGSLFGLDDMGNSAASRYASATFANGNATTAGSIVGSNTHTLVTGELPSHTHGTGTLATASDGAHTHTTSGTAASNGDHTHTASVTDPGHTHDTPLKTDGAGAAAFIGNGSLSKVTATTPNTNLTVDSNTTGITVGNSTDGAHTHSVTGTAASNGAHTHTISGTTGSTGSGTAHNNVSYGALGTYYQKL